MKPKKVPVLMMVAVLSISTFLGVPPDSKAEEPNSSVGVYPDKWGVVPQSDQVPDIDGTLDDPLWQEANSLRDFVTAYNNEPAESDTEVKMSYDDQNLYIGFDYASQDGGASLANLEILLSPDPHGGQHFRIPVKINPVDTPYVNDWSLGGPSLEDVQNVQTAIAKQDDSVMAEMAVPFDSIGVDEVSLGDEWRFNAIVQHKMETKPLSSWIPIRTSKNWYNGSGSAKVEANVTSENRFGTIFMGAIPANEASGETFNAWEPEQLDLIYKGFTEKKLTFESGDTDPEQSEIQLNWKAPTGDWQAIEELQVEKVGEMLEVIFHHPQPLEDGLYQLQILIGQERHAIVSFDRHSLIEAGDATFKHNQASDEEKRPVPLETPSDEVAKLLELIPEKTGFIFVGLPDQPELHPYQLYDWSPDDPWTLTSQHSDLTYPNDQYPEDQVMMVKNKKGEVVEYPYYEDESGKRYFITAHIWYKQKDYVVRQLKRIADEDPLGAARLLYRFAQVYEGWVPTNEYPWHNRPVHSAAGPPFYYWGGMWYRWSAAELGANFSSLAEAYAMVKETDAFDVLSDDVGEDVESKIIHDMLEPSVAFFNTFPEQYGNMASNNAVGLIALGKALDDPSYIHRAVEWVEKHVESTYLFDGFFKETTLSYHNQTVNGLNEVLNALKGWSDPEGYISPRSGTRLDDLDMQQQFPILHKAMEMSRLLSYPNGSYYPTQDTWANEETANPDLDAGSFLLPASGIARLARGTVPGSSAIIYDFPSLDIVEQSVAHRNISGTLQLEANEADHHISFAFDVPKTDTYAIDLKPFRAPSYGRYDVEVDGETITEVNFYDASGGPRDFEVLGTMELTEGTHQLTFRNVGKNDVSTNYKMGLIQLALLDEEAQKDRDNAKNDELQDDPTQLYLSFQPKYGHHHYDPLGLTLYDEGQELLPDIGYTHTFYRLLTYATLSHNTVVVDSEDMTVSGEAQHGGNIDVFTPIDDHVQVIRANQETAYPQTDEYSREPWFIQFPDAEHNEGYVLDLFRVSGGDRHEYSLQGDANHDAAFETDIALSDYGPYLLPEGVEVREPETETDRGSAEGHYYGYINVRNVKKADIADGQYNLTLVTEEDGQEKAKMRIIGLAEPGQNELFIGESPSLRATRLHGTSKDTNDEAVKYMMPKMVLRREGNDLTSHFITAMEPYTDGKGSPRIETIERLEPDQATEGDLAVKVTYGDTTDIILSSLNPEQPLVVGEMTLQGKMGMIRLKDGGVQDMYLVGGTSLKHGDVEMTGEGPIAGTVTDVRRQAAGDHLDAFIVDIPVPANMQGNTIVITHPDGKTHGYKIKKIANEDDQTVITIDDMDPGFAIHDDGTSAMQYFPFTEWTGATTFRIENAVQGPADQEVSVDAMRQLVQRFEDEGLFENDWAVRALETHLTAVGIFEQQGTAEKIIKHMAGFEQLLDYQKDQELLSIEAYDSLMRKAEAMIKQWQ